MPSHKLKSSKKERKKESHEDIGASERDFFTHMGVGTVLVVVRVKQCGCQEEEGQTHTGRGRETGIGRVEGRQTTTTRRQEGSTASCSNKAREREQSDGLWAAATAVSGKLRSSERNKRDIYRGHDELRALDSTDKH